MTKVGKEETDHVITLRRPQLASSRLGLDITMEEGSLIIAKIDGGLIDEWNKAHPDNQAMPGEYLIAANGQIGTLEQVLLAIKAPTEELELTLRRRTRAPCAHSSTTYCVPGQPYYPL